MEPSPGFEIQSTAAEKSCSASLYHVEALIIIIKAFTMDHGEDVKVALESSFVTGVSDNVILLSLREHTYLKRQKDLVLGKLSGMF